jgi:arylsulfatase
MPARLLVLLLCGCIALAGCGRRERTGAVLITVDTLRADHVGAFGDEHARTPRMDVLARQGTLYERAISPLPLTRPSHFSMLTSRYPREHGVLNNSTALSDAALTLPEILRGHGWQTAAFTAVQILGPDSGGAQGFERFESSGQRRERSGAEVIERALDWLDQVDGNEPFFLWVHLYEPHVPYAPPPGFRSELDPAQAAQFPALTWIDFRTIALAHGGDIPEPIVEHARRLYRGEVSAADELVGRLIDGVAARTSLDDVLVLLTADHGECFENGIYFEHADCLYEGALHVPMIVRYPREFPAGMRVPQTVSILDVAPTILRAAGLPLPEALAGHPLQDAASQAERYVLVQHPFYSDKNAAERRTRLSAIRSVAGQPVRRILTGSQWLGVVGPRWKLLDESGALELYPMAPRPDESQNRVTFEPEVAADLRRRLHDELAAHPLTHIPPGEVSEDLRRALQALGYVE